jgi:hypothetical protein
VAALNDVRDFANPRRGARRHGLAGDGDEHRGFQIAFGDGADRRRHGRREQGRLMIVGDGIENGHEIVGEAHVEHLVGLVEHDEADSIENERPAPNVVQRAPRCRDNDIDAAPKHTQLLLHRLSTIDRQDAHVTRSAIAMHSFGDLHRELACGDENQRADGRRIVTSANALEQRQRERGRFSGSSRRLAERIAAGEQGWNRLALNGGRFLVSERGDGRHKVSDKAERGEW